MQNKPDEARKLYEHALSLDPQMPVAANNLAWDYAERGQNLDVALNLAQTAKAKLPNTAAVSDTLGWVYYKKGAGGPRGHLVRGGGPTGAIRSEHSLSTSAWPISRRATRRKRAPRSKEH